MISRPFGPRNSAQVRALSDGATSEDVARCATSASMLAPVDLDDASAAGLRGLLASTAYSRLGPNGLNIEKETTHFHHSWRRRASMA